MPCARLVRPWFSGGTTSLATVCGGWHRLAAGEAAFEDGQLDHLSIPDVTAGLAWIGGIGIDVINRRVDCLTRWLLDNMACLMHGDGSPMVRVYGPRNGDGRGGTVAFSFLDPRGEVVDERIVDRDATAAGISLGHRPFCNPGVIEAAFGLLPRACWPASRRGSGRPWRHPGVARPGVDRERRAAFSRLRRGNVPETPRPFPRLPPRPCSLTRHNPIHPAVTAKCAQRRIRKSVITTCASPDTI